MHVKKLTYNKQTFWKVNLLFLSLVLMQVSCNKMTDAGAPTSSLTSDNVYENDATANSVLLGIYASLSSTTPARGVSIHSISVVTGLSADDLTLHGGASNVNTTLAAFYLNQLTSGSPNSATPTIWNDLYAKIYTVNIALEKLKSSSNLTSDVKNQLLGETYFLRAFFYFYLVNLYGDVPLAVNSDYRINSKLARTSKSTVNQQIISDLQEAQSLLNENFVGADGKSVSFERLRPNKYAAIALLARVYLYTGAWAKAEEQASTVINKAGKFKLTTFDQTFLRNSDEAIWQLQPVNTGWNTEDARLFILPSAGPTSNSSVEGYPVYLSSQLISSLELGDQRRTNWIGQVEVNGSNGTTTYYYPHKYKSASLDAPVTEFEMVLRLAEQYLIRAEARAQQDNLTGAKSDLDIIRSRAGLDAINAGDRTAMLSAIYHERQVELFTEWGHRWLDLKRTGRIDQVMTNVVPLKGTTWNSNYQWYPIPFYDIVQNGNLMQNTGY